MSERNRSFEDHCPEAPGVTSTSDLGLAFDLCGWKLDGRVI